MLTQVASYLYNEEKMNVLVEPELHDIFARIPGFGFIQTFYTQDTRYYVIHIVDYMLKSVRFLQIRLIREKTTCSMAYICPKDGLIYSDENKTT